MSVCRDECKMAKQRDVDAPLVPTSPLMRTAIAVVGGVVSGVSYPPQTIDHGQYFFSEWNQHTALTIWPIP